MRLSRPLALTLALVALLLLAGDASAGRLRDRVAARRGCSSCQQPAGVAFRPAPTACAAGPAVSHAPALLAPACASGRCPIPR